MKTATIISMLFVIALLFGYGSNVVKLAKSDFSSPYKNEVLRGVGLFVPPLGIILGYIDIKDE